MPKLPRVGLSNGAVPGKLNPCMPYWIRDQEGRLVRIETPRATELEIILEVMENQPKDQHSQHGQGNDPNLYRSMRDRMHPPRMSAPSCIIPPTEQLIIRPHIVPLLPTFHGMESENPYAHIKEFEDVCNTFQEGGTAIELMRTNGLKRQISNFSARENEKFYECWERYMEAINACPHHGFDTWLLNPEEAMDFLSYVSEVSRGWDEPNSREMGKRPVQQMSRGGMYSLSEDMEMKAKVAAMARKIEEMELRKVHEAQAISEPQQQANPCSHMPNPYQSPAQSSQQSQGQSSVEQALISLSKVMGDFVSEQKSINSQLNQKIDNVESTLNKKIDGMHNELSQKIDYIQYSISRLTNLNTVNEKGKFPSQPHQNPKGIHEVESKDEDSSKVRDVQAIITLRSGKEVHQPEHDQRKAKEDKADRKEEKKNEQKGKEVQMKESIIPSMMRNPQILLKEGMMKKHMPPPFPQALRGKKPIKNASEILNVLR
ncbi:hypothetical protein CK203_054701 [Vitis vinifera]|uniref:Retrotransposon gag domain-containing protein n=1 Tax=Vitis vinifera TaxID=29760 RepID=A0A438H1U7_VITVI|nr:hypothetical protein CK203_054701 [Vitis vinifera]